MKDYLHLTDIVGYIGSAIIVLQYYLNLRGRIDSKGLLYPLANLLAGICLMISLSRNLNMPSVAIETFWCAISVYGVIRFLLRGRR